MLLQAYLHLPLMLSMDYLVQEVLVFGHIAILEKVQHGAILTQIGVIGLWSTSQNKGQYLVCVGKHF